MSCDNDPLPVNIKPGCPCCVQVNGVSTLVYGVLDTTEHPPETRVYDLLTGLEIDKGDITGVCGTDAPQIEGTSWLPICEDVSGLENISGFISTLYNENDGTQFEIYRDVNFDPTDTRPAGDICFPQDYDGENICYVARFDGGVSPFDWGAGDVISYRARFNSRTLATNIAQFFNITRNTLIWVQVGTNTPIGNLPDIRTELYPCDSARPRTVQYVTQTFNDVTLNAGQPFPAIPSDIYEVEIINLTSLFVSVSYGVAPNNDRVSVPTGASKVIRRNFEAFEPPFGQPVDINLPFGGVFQAGDVMVFNYLLITAV